MTAQTEVKETSKVSETQPQTQSQTQPSSPENKPPETTSKPPEETLEQINWRKFRQEREKERKEKLDTEKRYADKEREAAALKAAMESLLNKPTPQNRTPEEEIEESEAQRIKRQVDEAFAAREKQYEADRQKREAAELPQRLSSTFSDFNQVCSQENLDYLEYHHPEIWAGFKHSQGNFDVWAGLYKTIKKLVPNTDTRKEQAKIEKNLSKPQSMSSPGITQTGDHAPVQLTEQRRKDNWKRMQAAMKSL